MEDLRKSELDGIRQVCLFLVQLFPQDFKYTKYAHPVFGERESLELLSKKKSVDLNCVQEINISLLSNTLKVKTRLGDFLYTGIFKEDTVI